MFLTLNLYKVSQTFWKMTDKFNFLPYSVVMRPSFAAVILPLFCWAR